VGSQQPWIPGRAERWIKAPASEVFLEHEGRHRFEHRHFERRPLPGGLSFNDRRHHRSRRDLAGDVVAQQQRHVLSRSTTGAQQPGDARDALQHAVVGRLASVRAVGTVPADEAVDEARAGRSGRRRVEPETLQGSGSHIGDHNVGPRQQSIDDFVGHRVLQIDADVALAPVEVEVSTRMLARGRLAAQGSHQITLGAFDLDDVRSELGETSGTRGTDHNTGQVKDPDPVEGQAALVARFGSRR
jgi:hypothetical protein